LDNFKSNSKQKVSLTFLAGIYEMNFEHFPCKYAENGFYTFLIVTEVEPILSINMINKRNWFK